MTPLLALFARLAVPERLRRPLAYLLAAIALIAALGALKGCYDRSVRKDYRAEVEARASAAREEAADQRVKDALTNTANEKDLHHAIDTAPKGGDLSPAARALACERLRKLGRSPAACGPASPGGAQASPR